MTYTNIKRISLVCIHIIKKITSYLSAILSRQQRGVYRSLSRYVPNTISPFYPLNGFLNLKRTMQEADAIFTIFLAHLIHLENEEGWSEMTIIRRWIDAIAWWFAFRECRLSFASCSVPNWRRSIFFHLRLQRDAMGVLNSSYFTCLAT